MKALGLPSAGGHLRTKFAASESACCTCTGTLYRICLLSRATAPNVACLFDMSVWHVSSPCGLACFFAMRSFELCLRSLFGIWRAVVVRKIGSRLGARFLTTYSLERLTPQDMKALALGCQLREVLRKDPPGLESHELFAWYVCCN